MINQYFQEIFYLPQLNREDEVIGKIERWEAHQKGILHCGFTAILFYQDQIVLQRRRHPVFDNFWDISFSSHPIYLKDRFETEEEAIIRSLKREWLLDEKAIEGKINFLTKTYYQAKDEKSGLIEHEIDYWYWINLKKKPTFNPEFAYEIRMINWNEIDNIFTNLQLAPWVEKEVVLKSLESEKVIKV
jgi:isopentenyl-diphosphate delta-isomerase